MNAAAWIVVVLLTSAFWVGSWFWVGYWVTATRRVVARLARLVWEWAEPEDPAQHPITAVREAWQMGSSKDPKPLTPEEFKALKRAWELRTVGRVK